MKRLYEFTVKKKESVEKEVPDVNKDGEEVTVKKTVEEEVDEEVIDEGEVDEAVDEEVGDEGGELGRVHATLPPARTRASTHTHTNARTHTHAHFPRATCECGPLGRKWCVPLRRR